MTSEEAKKYRLWPFYLPQLILFCASIFIADRFPNSGFLFAIPVGIGMVFGATTLGEVLRRQRAYKAAIYKEKHTNAP